MSTTPISTKNGTVPVMRVGMALCICAMFNVALVSAQQSETAKPSHLQEAESLFDHKQYAAVVKKLERVWVEQRGELPIQAAYWLGVSYYEIGEFSHAQPLLVRVESEINDTNARYASLTRLANISLRQEEYDRAINQLLQASDCAPTEAEFQKQLLTVGDIQLQREDFEEALQTFAQISRAYPQNAVARVKYLRTLYRAGRYEDCLAHATESIAQVPIQHRAETTYLMAASHRRLKNFGRAIELYEQLLQTFPLAEIAPDARYELALSYYEKGDFRVAARQADAALRGNLSRAERLRFLWLAADSQARLARWQSAKELYQAIAETTTDREVALSAIQAMLLIAKIQGRPSEVEALARMLREKFSSSPPMSR